MASEYGVKLQIEPKMFRNWQRYTQRAPEVGGDEGEVDTLKSVGSIALQALTREITDEMPNGVEVEIRMKEVEGG